MPRIKLQHEGRSRFAPSYLPAAHGGRIPRAARVVAALRGARGRIPRPRRPRPAPAAAVARPRPGSAPARPIAGRLKKPAPEAG